MLLVYPLLYDTITSHRISGPPSENFLLRENNIITIEINVYFDMVANIHCTLLSAFSVVSYCAISLMHLIAH